MLAGLTLDYYVRLERGDLSGASDSVLAALAHALQLDDDDTTTLFDLARAGLDGRRPPTPPPVRPSVQRVLDSMSGTPAWIRNGRADVLATNTLGRALYSPVFQSPAQPPNTARFTFLDPSARDFYVDWERAASDAVTILHAEAGRHPHDPGLTSLLDELSSRSAQFRVRWAAHDVLFHRTSTRRVRHPDVGHLYLAYEAFELVTDPGLKLIVYTAEPGTPTAQGIDLLARVAAAQPAPRPPSWPVDTGETASS